MGLRLHRWYTADEAVAGFGGDASAASFCEGQFVVLPGVVLCLATLGETLGETTEEPEVTGPSDFVWRPHRLDYEPSEELPWLPEPVREVWDRSQKPVRKLREHQIFLRTTSDERYFYAGPAHLGSYTLAPGRDGTKPTAEFSLSEKLPRDVWLKFGGYPGWSVEVNDHAERVACGDLAAFERLVSELLRQEFSHLWMTRYEGDTLTLYTNARRGWLMYQRSLDDRAMSPLDPEYGGDPGAKEVFGCVCGVELDYPARRTLPRELAMRAAVEFFEAGPLPGRFHWESE